MAKTTRKPPAKELAHITPGLRAMALPVADLVLHPENVKVHGDKSIQEIAKSLEQFGQTKPIVVQSSTMRVLCGNGTLQACLDRGWKYLAANVIEIDDARAAALAIADNRSAEFSTWDAANVQKAIDAAAEIGITSIDVGFTEDELSEMVTQALGTSGTGAGGEHREESAGDQSGELPSKFQVVVTCTDEADQLSFLDEMRSAERECRVLNS